MKIINLHYLPCFEKPTNEEMLSYDVLELHEAAFLLTGWPDMINKCFYPEGMSKKNIARKFFYLPAPPHNYQGSSYPFCLDPKYPGISKKDRIKIAQKASEDWIFNPNDMGKEFLKIYNSMKEAVISGELVASTETLYIGDVYKENISYFVSPLILIKWALLKGFGLSEDIQCAEKLYVMKGMPSENTQDKVKNKIVYQFLKEYFPENSDKDQYRHVWMQQYGTADESQGEEYGSIRKATSTLRKKRPRGAVSKEDKMKEAECPLHLIAIEEVIYKDSANLQRYDVPLLRVAMQTAANILLEKFNEEFYPDVSLSQFLEYFKNNKIVSLYTSEAHPIILGFIEAFADAAVADFFMFHECELLMKRLGNFYFKGEKIE